MLLPLYGLASFLALSQAALVNNSAPQASDDDPFNHSPSFYPTPQGGRINDGKWQAAFYRARELVDQMSIAEKVNLTTGVGSASGPCSGNTGSVPRLNISSICVQDGPLSVRAADLTDVFPCGMAASSSFNKQLIYDRAVAIGSEFKGKGADAILGPVYGPMGVKAAGGRGWEGHGPDPYLEGVIAYLQTIGIQSQGVVSTAKHLIGNEQEHFRFAKKDKHAGKIDPGMFNTTSSLSSEIDDRAMHEIYLWPFAEAVRGGVSSIMCSYNKLNGSHACQNSYLLNYLLKEELGFQGFVMTDWGALYSGIDAANAGLDMDMPGEAQYFGGNLTTAVLNGTLPQDRLDDMATRILSALIYSGVHNPDGPNYNAQTFLTEGHEYFKQQEGDIVVLNKHVDVRSDINRAVALRSAVEGVVLLKNEHETLPLGREKVKRISILGQAAGDDSKGTSCSLRGCGSGAIGTGYGSGAGTFSYFVTPADGIGARAQQEKISYEFIGDSWNQAAAMDSALYADAAIVVANSVAGEEIGDVDGNYGDLNNLTLWHNAVPLIKNISSINNNTIVIVTSGQQIDLEPFIDNENVTAVIYSSYLGQDFGTALAKVLFGDENPSGKLPFTIAKDVNDYIPVIEKVDVPDPVDKFTESIYVDYRYFDEYNKPVRYEFGYGLSYSNFSLSDIEIETLQPFSENAEPAANYSETYQYKQSNMDPSEYTVPEGFKEFANYTYPYIHDASSIKANSSYDYPEGYSTEQLDGPKSLAAGGLGGNPHLWDVGYVVTAKVTNQGPYAGGFAPQLYVGYPDNDEFPTPPVQLRGFEKVFLDKDYSETVSFELTRKDLSVWDTKTQSWIVLRGDYKIYVGQSSRQLDLVTTLTLE
ncbi:unnamed protein product [Wickerhamomyces anomalus]